MVLLSASPALALGTLRRETWKGSGRLRYTVHGRALIKVIKTKTVKPCALVSKHLSHASVHAQNDRCKKETGDICCENKHLQNLPQPGVLVTSHFRMKFEERRTIWSQTQPATQGLHQCTVLESGKLHKVPPKSLSLAPSLPPSLLVPKKNVAGREACLPSIIVLFLTNTPIVPCLTCSYQGGYSVVLHDCGMPRTV